MKLQITKKHIAHWTLMLLTVVASVIIGLFLILQLPWVQKKIIEKILGRFQQASGFQITSKKLYLSWFDQLEISDLSVKDDRKTQLLSASDITIDYHFLDIFSNGNINNIDTSVGNLNICIQYPNQKGAVLQLNKDLSFTTLVDSNQLSTPKQSVLENNNFWIADSSKGLLLKNNTTKWVSLGGPNASIQGISDINDSKLIAPFANTNTGYATFNEAGWNTVKEIGNFTLPILNASAISNLDNSIWLASNSFLFHLTNENKLQRFR
jgi:hypothetical protein